MTNPIVGGVKPKGFSTGLESFDIPWDFGSQSSGSSGSRSSSSGSSYLPSSFGSDADDDDAAAASSGGGMDIAKMQQMMQMQKTKEDFQRMVKQAKFFLPRTLEGIAGQYGSQGSYWSSGRRDAQQEAAKKTQFDLAQAKSDAEFQIQSIWLEMAAQNQAEQGGRSA